MLIPIWTIFIIIFGTPISIGILVALKDLLFPAKSEEEKQIENKVKKELEKEKALKEEQLAIVKKEARICPYISNFVYVSTTQLYWAYCHKGTIYDFRFQKITNCAIASECPGAYHQSSTT